MPTSEAKKADRLTITLGKGQKKSLKEIAIKRRTSLATVIRWALDDYVAANASVVNGKRSKSASKAG